MKKGESTSSLRPDVVCFHGTTRSLRKDQVRLHVWPTGSSAVNTRDRSIPYTRASPGASDTFRRWEGAYLNYRTAKQEPTKHNGTLEKDHRAFKGLE